MALCRGRYVAVLAIEYEYETFPSLYPSAKEYVCGDGLTKAIKDCLRKHIAVGLGSVEVVKTYADIVMEDRNDS